MVVRGYIALMATGGNIMAREVVIELLGPLRVRVGGEDAPLGGPRLRALLIYLVLHREAPVPAERIIHDLWGASAHDGARRSLQTYVSTLRGLLDGGGTEIHHGPAGYRLDATSARIDLVEFDRLCSAAASGDTGAAAAALELWRGDPLYEVADQPWAQPVAAELVRRRLDALLVHLDDQLEVGLHDDAASTLARLIDVHPFDERLWERYLLALYRLGRQVDALTAYGDLATRLREELGLDPDPKLIELHRRILRRDPKLDCETAEAAPHFVPATYTSFVGRASEIHHLHQLLRDYRLVTITGPGGVGKTRTAIELANGRRGTHRSGIRFVDLAPCQEPNLVVEVLARQLGLRCRPGTEIEALAERFAPGDDLLVLDNCEHVTAAVAEVVVALLRASPRLRILVTSRMPLGVVGEVTWTLPPLEVPPLGEGLAVASQRDAVRLLVERLRTVQPSFVLDETNAGAIAHLCRRLDGLPLALELAASRLRSMGVWELTARLDDSLEILRASDPTADVRHRTLSGVLEWSVELLDAPARDAYRRLAALPGSFDAALAAGVCGVTESAVVERLDALVSSSLVTVDTTGPVSRYRMLEVVRDHAAALPHTPEVQRAIDDALVSWCWQVVGPAAGPGEPAWVHRLILEEHNLTAALIAAERHRPDDGIRLATRLVRYWSAHLGDPESDTSTLPTIHEGIRWLERLLQAAAVHDIDRDNAVAALGFLRTIAGEPDAVLQDLLATADRMEARGQHRRAAWARYYAALATWAVGAVDLASQRFETAFAQFVETDDRAGSTLAALQQWLIGLLHRSGHTTAAAREWFIAHSSGSRSPVLAFVLRATLALEALAAADVGTARDHLRQAVAYVDSRTDPVWTASVAALVAWWAALAGHPATAERLLAAARDVEARSGIHWPITTALADGAARELAASAPAAGTDQPVAGAAEAMPGLLAEAQGLLDA